MKSPKSSNRNTHSNPASLILSRDLKAQPSLLVSGTISCKWYSKRDNTTY